MSIRLSVCRKGTVRLSLGCAPPLPPPSCPPPFLPPPPPLLGSLLQQQSKYRGESLHVMPLGHHGDHNREDVWSHTSFTDRHRCDL